MLAPLRYVHHTNELRVGSIRVVDMAPEHVYQLRLQSAQAHFAVHLSDAYVAALIEHGEAYAAIASDGTVIACAGVIGIFAGRAEGWALLSDRAGRHMVALTRAVLRWLRESDFRRVQTTVDPMFDEGHRWARALGFQREGTLRSYTADGRDADLYARVRG